ncbi:MAG: hypothetical protein K1X54_11390, partial [Flavobacteriales bacterium]|nr:hypothetical protein [Flavobacteriales bacterium]
MIKTLTPLVFLLSMLTAHSQSIDWYLNIGNEGYDPMAAMDIDDAGNVYIATSFDGTVDLDPGTDELLVGSIGPRSLVVVKYSSEGSVIWYQLFGDVDLDAIYAKNLVYRNNSLWISGHYSGDLDFDPGITTDLHSSAGFDNFILKLNDDGEFVKCIELNLVSSGGLYEIKVDDTGQVYGCGILLLGYDIPNNIDLDPTANDYPITAQSSEDGFVVKYNQDLDLVWAKQFTSSSGLYNLDIDIDQNGQLFCAGTYFGQADFNAGNPDGVVGENEFVNVYGQNFLVKIYSNGDFGWIKTFGGEDTDLVSEIRIDPSNNIYILGSLNSSGDFDPGDGIHIISSDDVSTVSKMFILYTDNEGNLLWLNLYGDGIIAMSPYTCTLTEDKLLVAGYLTNSNFILRSDLSGQSGNTIELPVSIGGIRAFQNTLFVNGTFNGTVDIDPGSEVVLPT